MRGPGHAEGAGFNEPIASDTPSPSDLPLDGPPGGTRPPRPKRICSHVGVVCRERGKVWLARADSAGWVRQKELAPVGISQTGARRTFRVQLTGCIRAALPRNRGLWRLGLFRADVLQALREAVSIDPTVLHKLVNVVLRDADDAPARSEPNVQQPSFGAEKVHQGFGAPESFGRFSNREELHGWRLPEASSRAEGEAEFAAFLSRRPAFNLRKQHRSSRHRSPLKSPVSILNTSSFSFPHQEQVPGPTPLNVTLTMTGLVSLEPLGRSRRFLGPSGRRVTGLIYFLPRHRVVSWESSLAKANALFRVVLFRVVLFRVVLYRRHHEAITIRRIQTLASALQ